jgi:hypothetical protein
MLLEAQLREAMLMALANTALVGSAATMLVGYVLCRVSATRIGTDFSLGRLESVELQRAVLVYKKVFERLQEIRSERGKAGPGWLARHSHRKRRMQEFARELRDLQAYAAHLRSTIKTLRCKPFRRFKWWLRMDSSRFALSCSLAICLTLIAGLGACTYGFKQLAPLDQQQALADEVGALVGLFAPQAPAERISDLSSNLPWLLAAIAAALYLYRRTQLRIEHARQFRELKKFALIDPDALMPEAAPEAAANDQPASEAGAKPAPGASSQNEKPWCTVLGLSASATLEEVKQAYRTRVRQNHPDLVHGMSPMLREIAEAQTKQLNAAYREALSSLEQV